MAYQYTARERKIVNEAREYGKDLRRRMRLMERVSTKAEKLSLSPPAHLGYQNIEEFKPVTFTCAAGHEVVMTPIDLIYERAQYGCKQCGVKARGNPDSAARAVFRAKCDEQGFDVETLTSLREKAVLLDRATGDLVEMWPKHIERWSSKRPPGVSFVADAATTGAHVFVFRGDPPIVKDGFVANLLKRFPVERIEKRVSIAKVIQTFVDDGDRVVNLSANPSWLGGNQYTWGQKPDA